MDLSNIPEDTSTLDRLVFIASHAPTAYRDDRIVKEAIDDAIEEIRILTAQRDAARREVAGLKSMMKDKRP